MRILIWNDGYWPRIGGIETQTFQLIIGLQKEGHQCYVLAQKENPYDQDDEIYLGVPIKRLDFNAKTNSFVLQFIAKSIRSFIKTFNPDIVHLNANYGMSLIFFIFLRSEIKCPFVFTLHSVLFLTHGLNQCIKKACLYSDNICCVSNWVMNEMKNQVPENILYKFCLVYNGLSLPNSVPTPLCFSNPNILLLGRFTSEKGFDIAIHAFSMLIQTGIKATLTIAGEGPCLALFQKLVFDLKISDFVYFLGPIIFHEVPDVINKATFILVPSLSESFGYVAVEALLMQRPVIASRVGGLPEIIIDQENGLLVPPNDPESLFQAMVLLIKNHKRTIKMGIKGQLMAREKFSQQKMVDSYLEIYQQSVYTRLKKGLPISSLQSIFLKA
jgi:glycosyltransferase involved in cell wall biosynthesis